MPEQALVIVDMQTGFTNDHTKHLPSKLELLQNKYNHCYATRFINRKGSSFIRWMKWSKFQSGDQNIELSFSPLSTTLVLDKYRYSCMNQRLLHELRSKNIDEIHLCGVDTDVCVSQSAVDFFLHGRFRPIVLTEFCASSAGPKAHEAALRILPRLIGGDQIR